MSRFPKALLEQMLRESCERSGVPLKVEDEAALRQVADLLVADGVPAKRPRGEVGKRGAA